MQGRGQGSHHRGRYTDFRAPGATRPLGRQGLRGHGECAHYIAMEGWRVANRAHTAGTSPSLPLPAL